MFLLNITRLTYVIIFIIHSIRAQETEFMFTTQEVTYDVYEGQKVILICIADNASITETTPHIKTTIVNNSILVERTFGYTINGKTHMLTITKVNRSQDGTLDVSYPPTNPPLCSTNYYTKADDEHTILQCEVERVKPGAYIRIANNSVTYNKGMYILGETSMIRKVNLKKNISIEYCICHVYQHFIQGNKKYLSYEKGCAFNNSTPLPAQPTLKSSIRVNLWEPTHGFNKRETSNGSTSVKANIAIISIVLIISVFN